MFLKCLKMFLTEVDLISIIKVFSKCLKMQGGQFYSVVC